MHPLSDSPERAPRRPDRRRRRWLPAALAALTVLGGGITIAVNAPAASAATVDTSASYVLVNRNSGKALDVYNLATNDGARITQWTRNDGSNQQWQFVDSGGGYYRLEVQASPARSSTSPTGPPPTARRSAVDRRQRHQPAVPPRRLRQRLRPADQPEQRQGRRGPGRRHHRRRQHRPVHRLGRRQPAMATRPRRRYHAAGHVHAAVDLPLDVDGPAGDPEVGVGLAQGLHPRPLQRPAPRLRARRTTPGRPGAR